VLFSGEHAVPAERVRVATVDVDLVKAGAADYLPKPWDDRRLLTTVRNLLALRKATLEKDALSRERNSVRSALAERYDLSGAVYESDAMHELFVMATQVAHASVPVLITGPNGAGKEVLAEVIQANSAVKHGPFVKVNVGALPSEPMESELFDAEAGAYTGSSKRGPAASRQPTAARGSSTRSGTCRWPVRRSCCGHPATAFGKPRAQAVGAAGARSLV
jgi:DNA-binding NtrC family response regulator